MIFYNEELLKEHILKNNATFIEAYIDKSLIKH